MKRTEILMQYLYNYEVYLEDDVNQLTDFLRYRHANSSDCLELIIALERLIAFKEFSSNVRAILHLDCD